MTVLNSLILFETYSFFTSVTPIFKTQIFPFLDSSVTNVKYTRATRAHTREPCQGVLSQTAALPAPPFERGRSCPFFARMLHPRAPLHRSPRRQRRAPFQRCPPGRTACRRSRRQGREYRSENPGGFFPLPLDCAVVSPSAKRSEPSPASVATPPMCFIRSPTK